MKKANKRKDNKKTEENDEEQKEQYTGFKISENGETVLSRKNNINDNVEENNSKKKIYQSNKSDNNGNSSDKEKEIKDNDSSKIKIENEGANKYLENKIEELENKIKVLDNENKELKNKIKVLENENKELKDDNKELKDDNKTLMKQIKELNKKNELIKSSEENSNKRKKRGNKKSTKKNNSEQTLSDSESENSKKSSPEKKSKNKKKNKAKLLESIPEEIIYQSIEAYPRATLIGLQNIGATCFMNSTLQCLSQTKGLTNYFLKNSNYNKIINNSVAARNPKDYQLAPVYYELIQNLWKLNGPNYYAPYNFMNRVNDMNPLFKKGEAGDAKDFIIFVLEQMHRELNKSLNMKKISGVSTLNQYDKNNTLMNFFNEFTENTSIISDLFFGFNETTNICLYCKNYYNGVNYPICYNYGIFNVLIFPLEEVKNMKNNNNMANVYNFYQGPTNVVNMDDCFLYNQKTDLFTGENKNYCNLCKQLSESHYTSKIYISPNILIIILNRGKGNIYKVDLDFQNTIDISNYVIQKDKPRIIYNLYGVITHLGESGPNAHFVATCKSPVDGKWYRYNDANVKPIRDFNADVKNFGIPYILFYEKC
jgi:ubiquitin C-terminal hydrolase